MLKSDIFYFHGSASVVARLCLLRFADSCTPYLLDDKILPISIIMKESVNFIRRTGETARIGSSGSSADFPMDKYYLYP